jgi:hypothetical protein
MTSRLRWRSAAVGFALVAEVVSASGAAMAQSGYDINQCVESWEDGTWRGGKVYRLRGSQLHLMLNRAAERARQNGAPGYYYETATHSTTERRNRMGQTTSIATYIGIRVLLGPRVSDPPSGLYLNAASWQNDPKVPECDFERQTGPAPNLP